MGRDGGGGGSCMDPHYNEKYRLADLQGSNMRLSDGQVMDYVKGNGPYSDERFELLTKAPEPVASTIAGLTVQLPAGTSPANEGTFREPGQKISDEFVAAEMDAMNRSTFDVVPVVGQPYIGDPIEQQRNCLPTMWPSGPYHTDPRTPSFPTLNGTNAIREKVQARIDALSSLEHQTEEMRATIKALTWVIEEIARNTVTLTNDAPK